MTQRDPYPLGFSVDNAGRIVELPRVPTELDDLIEEASRVPHRPRRRDDVETWLKRMRDQESASGHGTYYDAVDALLDRYRECADHGLTLRPEDDEAGDP